MIICGSVFVSKHAFADVYARLTESSFRSTLKFSSVSPSFVLALRIMDATYLFTRLRMTSWGIEGEEEKASNQTELPNLVNLEMYSWIFGVTVQGKRETGKTKPEAMRCNAITYTVFVFSYVCVIAELYLLTYLIMLILYQPVSMLFLKGETNFHTVIMQGNCALCLIKYMPLT